MQVSVYIITYNRAPLLARAITSVLKQTVPNFELVIVDDGSTDHTEKIVAEFNDPRIRFYKKKHTGIPDSRNYAIKKCRGQWIAWLDSDDAYMENYLEKHLKNLEGENEHVVSHCDFIDISTNGSVVNQFHTGTIKKKEMARKLIHEPRTKICATTTVCAKELIEQCGGYDTSMPLSSDLEFAIRLLFKATKFKYIDEVIYHRFISKNDGISYYQDPQKAALVDTKLLDTLFKTAPHHSIFPNLINEKKSQLYENQIAFEKFKAVLREFYMHRFHRYQYENLHLKTMMLKYLKDSITLNTRLIRFWRAMLFDQHKENIKFAIYGGGVESQFTLNTFNCQNLEFLGIINSFVSNRKKENNYMVFPLDDPIIKKLDMVLLSSYFHEEEMEKNLKTRLSEQAEIIKIYQPRAQ